MTCVRMVLKREENFGGAMKAMANLRAPVDAFFDKVTVNAPEADLRANRLRLLSKSGGRWARSPTFRRSRVSAVLHILRLPRT